MAKLTREDKIEIYNKHKDGRSYSSLSKEYNMQDSNLTYLIALIDYHGEEVLRIDKNNYYSKELKEEIINRVLIDGKSARSVAIEYGLTSAGMLINWIRSYKENNYVIVEKTRGRKPKTMTKILEKEIEITIDYESLSIEEKLEYLEKKNKHLENHNSQLEISNLYLEAEAEYLKKLHAVVQKRTQQQKKK